MAIFLGNSTIKRKDFSFDKSKVETHEVMPTGLELILSHDRMGTVYIELELKEYREGFVKNVTMGQYNRVYDSRKQQKPTSKQLKPIEKRYNEILGILEKGKYVLHLYGNGNIEIDLLGEKKRG